jgi:hypothetical protein
MSDFPGPLAVAFQLKWVDGSPRSRGNRRGEKVKYGRNSSDFWRTIVRLVGHNHEKPESEFVRLKSESLRLPRAHVGRSRHFNVG